MKQAGRNPDSYNGNIGLCGFTKLARNLRTVLCCELNVLLCARKYETDCFWLCLLCCLNFMGKNCKTKNYENVIQLLEIIFIISYGILFQKLWNLIITRTISLYNFLVYSFYQLNLKFLKSVNTCNYFDFMNIIITKSQLYQLILT